MWTFVSAIWGQNADGTGVANYRVREANSREEAAADVAAHRHLLERQGFRHVGQYRQPAGTVEEGTADVSACQVWVHRNEAGDVRETGYWSQMIDRGGSGSTECEAAYLMTH